ncbi:MAG: DNA-binding protein [Acidobacteriota bacterium]
MQAPTFRFAALPLLAVLLVPAVSQGPGPRGRVYDPATETTVSGTVDKVTTVDRGGNWQGIHLTLKSGEETYDVHAGPSAFIADKGFSFAAGDQLEVLGSKVTLNNAPALIAREIRKDGKSLTLRNSSGIPLWAGQGRRWR